jgi:hypothetical protein
VRPLSPVCRTWPSTATAPVQGPSGGCGDDDDDDNVNSLQVRVPPGPTFQVQLCGVVPLTTGGHSWRSPRRLRVRPQRLAYLAAGAQVPSCLLTAPGSLCTSQVHNGTGPWRPRSPEPLVPPLGPSWPSTGIIRLGETWTTEQDKGPGRHGQGQGRPTRRTPKGAKRHSCPTLPTRASSVLSCLFQGPFLLVLDLGLGGRLTEVPWVLLR